MRKINIDSPMERKKTQARYHYVYEGLTAKQTAQKVMTTEKTLGKWVRDYNWKAEREQVSQRHQFEKMELDAAANIVLGQLRVFLSHHYRELYQEIEKGIDAFIVHNMNKDQKLTIEHEE